MAVGHWNTLAEAQKLTQSHLVPKVIEEDVKRFNLLERLPVAQALGKSIKWNRENAVVAAAQVDVGEQLSWTAAQTYDQQETELKRCYVQRVLDKFVSEVYGTINNYEAQMLLEMEKGMVRHLGNQIIYGDLTYSSGNKEADGLHALAAVQTGTDLDIDEAGGLSLANLRTQIDAMKHGVDFILMPFEIARRVDAAYQETGFVALKTATAGNLGMISYGVNEQGRRVTYFDGIPIIRTDYLVAEQAATGEGSSAMAVYSSGTKEYSAFCVKLGNVIAGEPGLCLGFGNTDNAGDFYRVEYFDKLEDYDAGGVRIVNYSAPLLGSKLCLGRIYGITDVAVVA